MSNALFTRLLFACLWLALAISPGLFCAQSTPIAFGRLTTEQGLSQDFVTSITQDRLGFVWFGTLDGLTRFDGRRCFIFRRSAKDTASLPDNRITGLTLDAGGKLWISTYKGICYLQPETRRIQRIPIPSPGNPSQKQESYFSNISFDKQGIAWTATDSFLVRLDPKTLNTQYFKIPCRTKQETQVFADSKGRVWITFLGQHLLRFDAASQQFAYMRGLDKPNGAANPWPMYVQEDSKGAVWSSDWDKAFYIYDEQRKEFMDFPDGGGIATVFTFDESAGPVVWAGGGEHGLWRLNLAGMQRTDFPPNRRDPYAHNNTRVHALYRDASTGIVWMGTEMGVEYYNPNAMQFERILLPEKPGQNQFYAVSGLMPDPADADRYWVSVWAVGLFEWNRRSGAFKLYDHSNRGVFSNEIFDMTRDADGNLWLATWKGIERFDPRTRAHRHYPQPAPWDTPADKVLSIEVGKDGRIWSGNNRGGLMETDPTTGTSRNIPLRDRNGNAFPYAQAWDIKIDPRGRVMVCSPNGLLRYDPQKGYTEQILARNPPLSVGDAVNGKDGRLYVGTVEGVYVLDQRDSLLFVLDTERGLYSQTVRKMECDLDGNIWIATTNGLHRYKPEKGFMEHFSKSDGLFLSDLLPGFRVMPNGELFVSGEYSFNIGQPKQLERRHVSPRIALDAIPVPSRPEPIEPGQPFVLQPNESAVTFEIAAIQFGTLRAPGLVYRLIGFDDAWRETWQHTITYTNLDGGSYTLQVRAIEADGTPGDDILEVPFRVRPVFYKTWWFAGLLLLIAAGILSSIAWYRHTVRQRMEMMRLRAVELEKRQLLNEIALLKTQVNPHFLFNSLSILSSLVHIDPVLSEKFIDQLSRSYRYILEQKDQSLVTLRTELEFIRSYAFLLKIRFEEKFDLRIQLEEPLLDQYKIAPLTLQLLVENAVKHNRMSAKEPLVVEVQAEDGILIVRNSLRPRPNPEPSTGTGLNNIISRYTLLTNKPVWAGEEDGHFVVKIPLL